MITAPILSHCLAIGRNSGRQRRREFVLFARFFRVLSIAASAFAIGFLSALLGTPAYADAYDSISLAGITWRIPAQFVQGKFDSESAPRSFSLRFELPDFRPVGSNDFVGVYPQDDKPILTVEISDDPKMLVGTPLLKKYISEAMKDCPSCTVDQSSVGGLEYTTFNGVTGLPPYSPDGILFRLYEYPMSGGQFAVCNFAADRAPTACEIKENLGGVLTATIRFPIEYLSQGLDLIGEVNERLISYQPAHDFPMAHNSFAVNNKPSCWAPAPGSFGAKKIPLKIGPETWHIPLAYGSSFGLNQTQDPTYDSISFWLKLPDLGPLSTRDQSPIEIAGFGNYIFVSIGYDDRPLPRESKSEVFGQLLKLSNHIGKNAFLNYDEYQEANSPSALRYLYSDHLIFVSDDPSSNGGSFPPDWFTCSQYGGAPSPGCTFRLNEFLNEGLRPGNYAGHYFIEYTLSRDYFSQIMQISDCVKILYDEFRFGT